jgi:hypothetical protein
MAKGYIVHRTIERSALNRSSIDINHAERIIHASDGCHAIFLLRRWRVRQCLLPVPEKWTYYGTIADAALSLRPGQGRRICGEAW